jgi:hypothetical protein
MEPPPVSILETNSSLAIFSKFRIINVSKKLTTSAPGFVRGVEVNRKKVKLKSASNGRKR